MRAPYWSTREALEIGRCKALADGVWTLHASANERPRESREALWPLPNLVLLRAALPALYGSLETQLN